MEFVAMILKRDLRSFITPKGKASLKRTIQLIAGVIFLLAVVAFMYYWSARLFSYLGDTFGFIPGLSDAISLNLLNGTAFFALAVVFTNGLQVAYRTMYGSNEIGFLLMQPIPEKAVFLSKFLSSYAALAGFVLIFSLPVWIGWGFSNGVGFGFYALMLLGFSLLLLLAHSVLSLALLAAMRFLPSAKMKQVFVAVAAMGGVLLVLGTQLLSAKMQFAGGDQQNAFLEQLGDIKLGGAWYLPSTWLVKAVLGTIPRFGIDHRPYLALLAVSALGMSWFVVAVSGRTYLAGWASRADQHVKTAPKGRVKKAKFRYPRPKGTYWTVLRKDIKTLFRDPIIWYSMVVNVIVMGFFIFNTSTQPTGMGMGPDMFGRLLVMMGCLLGSVTSAQTGGVSLSREGESLWTLKANPTVAKELFWAKWTYAFFPGYLILALTVILARAFKLPGLAIWFGLLLGAIIMAGIASLQILLDVHFPDFSLKIEFGSKSSKGTGKLLITLLLSMAYVFSIMIIQFRIKTLAHTITLAVSALPFLLAVILGIPKLGKVLSDS